MNAANRVYNVRGSPPFSLNVSLSLIVFSAELRKLIFILKHNYSKLWRATTPKREITETVHELSSFEICLISVQNNL